MLAAHLCIFRQKSSFIGSLISSVELNNINKVKLSRFNAKCLNQIKFLIKRKYFFMYSTHCEYQLNILKKGL